MSQYVSKKIRDSARDEQCAFRFPGVCKNRTETTVFCHINTRQKGMARKSPDLFGAYGCFECHTALDQHLIDVNAREILDAMVETQYKLLEKGLVTLA